MASLAQRLSEAIALAAAAHSGQFDKSGRPYILHPIRVMQSCEPHGEKAQIVAVLHDVVEDTAVTFEDLRRAGFEDEIVAAVDAISHRTGVETYFEYIERCANNRIAALVKLADLEDNASPARRFGRDFDSLLQRYERARRILLDRLEIQVRKQP